MSFATGSVSMLLLAFAAAAQGRPVGDQDEGGTGAKYLPVSPTAKWVLRNAGQTAPVIFEVVRNEGNEVQIRSTTPWGMSEWTLSEQDGRYAMTAYGTGGPMMPLRNRPVYLDFTRPARSKWSNSLGAMTVVSLTAEVHSRTRIYHDCAQILHKAGKTNLIFTFARGVGFVQFGEGKSAFIIDESASTIPGAAPPRQGPEKGENAPLRRPAGPRTATVRPSAFPLFGITPNKFANEALTVDVMMSRFHQTIEAGAGFLVGNGKWAELEPRAGQYSLDSVQQLLSAADEAKLPISYTLRVVDTVARDVPRDLRDKAWTDPLLQSRLLALIDALAPMLKGRARWFMLGYEVDGYFSKHPGEVQGFVDLHRAVAARIKDRLPGIEVSSTLMYAGIDTLGGTLAGLNRQLDFIALTYCPLAPDFTVEEPSVLPGDFRRMKEAAAGRKIVFQEIAYPTAAATRSSQEKQAEFYRLAFAEFTRDPSAFEAVNFMTLADLSDAETQRYASFYGLAHNSAFKGTLQTLGLFDQQGRPKKSWEVLRQQMARPR